MKLLIIGASGMIGQHVYDYAREHGCDVIGTCYQKRNDTRLVPFDLLTQDITEVLDPKFLNSCDEKIALICSAMSKIDQCKAELEKSHQLNVVCTQNLIQKLDRHGFKITYTSSSAVYDGFQGGYDESSPCLPISEYGRQKCIVENFMIDTLQHPLIFRLDKIVSSDLHENNLFSDLWMKSQNQSEIPCLEQIFSPTYVKDLGPVFFDAWKNQLVGIYNLCNPIAFSRYDLAKLFLSKKGDVRAINKLVIKPMSYFRFLEPRMLRSDMNIEKLKNKLCVEFTAIEDIIDFF